ncbi:hypothetical protein C0993_002420 [Termitomyces sp. T159_Od127]|nr:hypothetical protein C0993_002420 [Termitomyces sp. T159_Od127]
MAGDEVVRVVVTPAQSSFFAGELFSVTVTFTNTHSTEPGASPRAHTHRRGAHSISSAPLARPPTSPGPPSTPVPGAGFVKRDDDASVRRGLVGKVQDELPKLLEQRRRRLLAKSLSVSIAPHELEEAVGEAMVAPRVAVPASPRVSSPLTRSETLSLGTAHPHARKASVLDGQAQVSLPTAASSASSFSLALDPIVEGVLSPCPSTPFLASPTFETPAVSAYPASRRHMQASLGHGHPSASLKAPPPSTLLPHTELILYSYAQLKGTLALTPLPGPRSPDQRHALAAARAALLKRPVVGGGRMDISSSLHPTPALGPGHRRRPTHSRTASFSGLLDLISPAPASPVSASFSPQSIDPPPPLGHGLGHRSRPSTSTPRTARFPSTPVGLGIGGMGITMHDDDVDSDVPLPTFQVQPAMLAVDLVLAPGQSRSYTYSILLPDVLPPTFKGRTLRFSYELEVGTCRAGHGPGSTSANSVSRVMKVPIRVYNNVVGASPLPLLRRDDDPQPTVGRTPRPYDVLWPLSKGATAPPPETQGKVVEETKKVVNRAGKSPIIPPRACFLPPCVRGHTDADADARTEPASTPIEGTFGDLQDYARRLLASFPDPGARGVRIKLPAEAVSPVPQSAGFAVGFGAGAGGGAGGVWAEEGKRIEREMEREMERAEGGLSGCREAVEILTRNPKKASYDVNKDGVKVAVLTFAKGAYRLGETVVGVVEINERQSRARVVQVRRPSPHPIHLLTPRPLSHLHPPARARQLSAILEAHESLPSTIAPRAPTRQLKRVHAEHHAAHLLATLRTTFALDIPADAAPAFQLRL